MHPFLAALLALPLLIACQTVYYQTLERFGVEKREILVDRVKSAQESQQEAKAQFEDALEAFIAATGYAGGELEETYDRLKDAFEESDAQAETVRERIAKVEDVAGALFAEWREELDQYSSASLRRASERQLGDTERRYGQLIRAMKRAEQRLDPVLDAFRDRVLYLKHNLNARAIAALKGDLKAVESDIAVLVRDMQASIDEADAFIRAMEQEAGGA